MFVAEQGFRPGVRWYPFSPAAQHRDLAGWYGHFLLLSTQVRKLWPPGIGGKTGPVRRNRRQEHVRLD